MIASLRPISNVTRRVRQPGVFRIIMNDTRILIVEDERHITKFLEFVLAKEGCTIASAVDGSSALSLIEDFRPDAILLDLGLPDMSGVELLRKIRGGSSGSAAKVIVLSATVYDGISEQLSEAGADAQCSKPIAPSTLVRMMRNLELLPAVAA